MYKLRTKGITLIHGLSDILGRTKSKIKNMKTILLSF
ncbi:hypothetical protein IWX76_003566 [Pedobacter sp. CAN_A7]